MEFLGIWAEVIVFITERKGKNNLDFYLNCGKLNHARKGVETPLNPQQNMEQSPTEKKAEEQFNLLFLPKLKQLKMPEGIIETSKTLFISGFLAGMNEGMEFALKRAEALLDTQH